MGITPIVNLAPLPLTRAVEKVLEPLPMERVEDTARTGDETYSPSNQGSSRGAEDDGPEDDSPDDDGPEEEFQNLAGEDDEQPSVQPAEEPLTRRISFLA
jgi:hypothetical protein